MHERERHRLILTAVQELTSYVQRIENVLQQSAQGRGQVGEVVVVREMGDLGQHLPTQGVLLEGRLCLPQPLLRTLALGDVDDGGQHERALVGLQRIEPDLDRDLGAVAAQPEQVTPEILSKVRRLNEIAAARGQSLAQMALAWVLRDARVTSVLIGASSVRQLEDNLKCLKRREFISEELAEIDTLLAE